MKKLIKKILYNLIIFIEGILKKRNWLEELKAKLLKRDFYLDRKNQIKIVFAIIIVVLAVVYFNQPKVDKKYYKESVFCQADKDCELYDCTSCGNKFWIDKKVRSNNCEKTIPGLAGCACQEGACKRIYK